MSSFDCLSPGQIYPEKERDLRGSDGPEASTKIIPTTLNCSYSQCCFLGEKNVNNAKHFKLFYHLILTYISNGDFDFLKNYKLISNID